MKLKENPAPCMGEVRIKVKLSNVADQAAVAAGRLAPEKARTIEADALVDTGAVRSCVPAALLQALGIQPYDRKIVEMADGAKVESALPKACALKSCDDAPATTR